MHYAVLRLRGMRVAVVLVALQQLGAGASELLEMLEGQLGFPAMLVARDDGSWKGLRGKAQFDVRPYLLELLAVEEVEWSWLELSGAPDNNEEKALNV
ncbi:hypothetical protein [Massilia sp. ZL223]|uniref:hypothetical protein n=1 Tax=Massilia sp. ZL223 TaxID=2824904 RepID=UPI001B817570|nr:hypothetical protein [Massilia sp. ZL223]MBQ5963172.1 hypothetical protein [Massilia sp. ZL223]